MKKILFTIFVVSFCSLTFYECDIIEENKVSIDEDSLYINKDGLYINGIATGYDTITQNHRMSTVVNFLTGDVGSGVYEKYVVLEANKDFYLLMSLHGVLTYYGAILSDFSNDRDIFSSNVTLLSGDLIIGENAPAMQVKERGLYYITVNFNLEKPQIVVIPVQWGISGVNFDWNSFIPMSSTSDFNYESKSFVVENLKVEYPCYFKFVNCTGWYILMDVYNNSYIITNLGNVQLETTIISNELVHDGYNIKLAPGIYTINLTWNLNDGDIKDNFNGEVIKIKDLENLDPSVWNLALIGSIGDTSWDVDYPFIYDAVNKNWYIENFAFHADEEFKIRTVDTWDFINLGCGQIVIMGDVENFNCVDDYVNGNIKVMSDAVYRKIILNYDFNTGDWSLDFQK